jgi:glutathione synthase/RimK-type ligase-like ATP-grasp enzyme
VDNSRCWGIFREATHSPGRESDDTEILRLTGKHLEAKGYQVTLKTADEVSENDDRPRFVFLMCERLDVLARLRNLELNGVPQVNSPRAVENTYRERMIAAFAEANVPFIQSRLVSTDERIDAEAFPVWVKRADVHNTQEGDVTFAPTAAAVADALGGLAARGIPRAVLQPHVEGDLIKFYGIGAGGGPHREPPWFRWFYHKDQRVAGHPMDPRRLARLVRRAASALWLEVYGGDAIATASGDLVLLDVNAWPSFALYRDEGSASIAAYLALRFAGGRR